MAVHITNFNWGQYLEQFTGWQDWVKDTPLMDSEWFIKKYSKCAGFEFVGVLSNRECYEQLFRGPDGNGPLDTALMMRVEGHLRRQFFFFFFPGLR